ncbi:ABC transporter substrate-binding protein [Ignatzschineria indica]|uniref:ABC transporter substrate-binding protein n=1 Tax=Ignatzschineria indica TaxID=472583 RepID=A0A2U2AQ40_9GAMM|nr:TRAP transporter substrate-binding protein DctP [Ignatzschineria indica]PWD85569.1 ABC transporter substrate-binding protein [Ignatzschineria indica]GGZ88369.1 ABC transporter substrate-binding protein [Ignatzschineria indica]
MKRRQFISRAGIIAGAGIGALSSAQANSNAKVKWRMTSSFPKHLDLLFGTSQRLADSIYAMSDGEFEIQVFAAGELVPSTQVFDAIQNGTVEVGHTTSNYYHGKNKALSIDTCLPFGLTTRMQNAWYYAGGGTEVLRELFDKYNIVNFPGGNSNTQMGGWFRKEVKTVDDLKGLKFRIPGFGGEIFSRLGSIPQNIAVGDIYSSLEKGTIDATEFVGPYDDQRLGLQEVAPYYYTPGFWEGSAMLTFYVNKDAWASLPEKYKIIFERAAAEANMWMSAQYDAKSPEALATLIQNGAKLRSFSREILQAAYDAAQEIYAEEVEVNEDFRRIYTHWKAFLNKEYQWFRVNENIFQQFMFSQFRKQTT